MQHVAIDLGGRESQVCVRATEGQILLERKLPTASLKKFLQQQPHSRIVLETCAEAFRVADFALSYKHEVRVVPATLVRSLGVGARRIKTDRRDAQVLSEVSCRIDLPSVHVPTDVARMRRSMCGMREELVSSRTALINCVRGWCRTRLLKFARGYESDPFGAHSRDSLEECQWASRLCRALAQDDRRAQRADSPRRPRARAAGGRRSGLQTADVRAGRWSGEQHALRGSDRRHLAIFHGPRRSELPRSDARREFKLGEEAAHGHYQGRTCSRTARFGPSCMEHSPLSSSRSDQSLGRTDRTTPRQVRCNCRGGAQACRHHVRSLARRLGLRAQSPAALAAELNASIQTLPVPSTGQRKPHNGCPEAVSASAHVPGVRPVPAPTLYPRLRPANGPPPMRPQERGYSIATARCWPPTLLAAASTEGRCTPPSLTEGPPHTRGRGAEGAPR